MDRYTSHGNFHFHMRVFRIENTPLVLIIETIKLIHHCEYLTQHLQNETGHEDQLYVQGP